MQNICKKRHPLPGNELLRISQKDNKGLQEKRCGPADAHKSLQGQHGTGARVPDPEK